MLGQYRRRTIAALLWLRSKNNQRGFTLIELLVVISILGILAAVVTMSMVGITRVAQQRAAAAELQTVQTAYDTMLAEQGVPQGSECAGAPGSPGTATADMSNFPTSAAEQYDPNGVPIPAHALVRLAPRYVRVGGGLDPNLGGAKGSLTHGTYYCTGNGTIVQAVYNP